VRITIAACLILTIVLPFAATAAVLTFRTETVDPADGAGQFASIVMDSQGRPWIGYRRVTGSYTGQYCVAVLESGVWNIEVAHANMSRPTRLVLMPGDVPAVAWPVNVGVHFISRPGAPGTQWVEESISDGYSPWAAQIECDMFGRVHAYNHWSYHYYGKLEYSVRDPSGWLTEQLDWSPYIFIAHEAKADIAVAADGTVHMAVVAVRQGENAGMEYWRRSGGSWSMEMLPLGDWPSIVVTPLGPLITYHDFVSGTHRYQWKVGGNWIGGTIDPFSTGKYSEIVQGYDGSLHVAYYDDGNGNLRYAVRATGSWELHTVDAGGDVGAYASIVLDVDGHPHFAYRDATNGALKYATLQLPTPVEVRSWGALKAVFERNE
jgi:hypothetical protein